MNHDIEIRGICIMYDNYVTYNHYEDRLLEADLRRKQNELIRHAEEYARRERGEQRNSIVQRFMRMFHVRSQPKQAANDAKRATAH